jgi:hypothetical protein
MLRLNMAGAVTNDDCMNRSVKRLADMFASRSSLSPRINSDERAVDRSSYRGVGACAQSE